MDPPSLRKKHMAKDKQKCKGQIYSQKHVRKQLERMENTEKNLKLVHHLQKVIV